MCGLTTVNCSELVKVINHGEELRDIRALIYGIRRLNWMYAETRRVEYQIQTHI